MLNYGIQMSRGSSIERESKMVKVLDERQNIGLFDMRFVWVGLVGWIWDWAWASSGLGKKEKGR